MHRLCEETAECLSEEEIILGGVQQEFKNVCGKSPFAGAGRSSRALLQKKFVRGCSGMVLPECPVRGMRGGT